MKRIFKYLFPTIVGIITHLGAVSVSASVDANIISRSDVFSYKVVAKDADQTPNVDISPLLKNFNIVSGPAQQTNVQWVNGKMTSSRSLTWTLTATKNGKILIPSLSITLGGMRYKTNPINMVVKSDGNTDATNADIFIIASADKETAFVGEQVTVSYKLFTKVNLSLSNVEYPKGTGFWVEDLRKPASPRHRDTQVNGVRYRSYTLYEAAFFPTKTGDLFVDPMKVNCAVSVNQKRKKDPFFDSPFFDSFFTQTVQKVIQSKKVKLNVIPYPSGKPSDFTGAVGTFTLDSKLDAQKLKVNEAVTFKINLRGTGNFNLFSLPEITFQSDIQVHSPTSVFQKETLRDQLTGELTIEYILIPREAGRVYIPKVELVYFNPETKSWDRAKTPGHSLIVEEGDQTAVAPGLSRSEVELLKEDIHYIKTDVPSWHKKGASPISIVAWLMYGFSALLFLSPYPLETARKKAIASAPERRSKAALRKALKTLSKVSENPDSEIPGTIYHYLSEKCGLDVRAMDPMGAQDILQNKISEALQFEIIRILSACDAIRYAPGQELEAAELIEEAQSVLTKIDEQLS
ncbi:MAG: protein BatD [Candidatus Marinimicrobia bacterium]|nr:protein BatD [Candidatus Neomarinimicrobiota bacterium]MBT3617855.1 protein BatD [Candidatus Neomarinimicrobiota bacterium]MBT3828212.1 protein BatD [Candidatus Neomarinimicrobiota bacterium]MBT4280595.1 protein BatD [Candidatus Neomarinimicrobiota bacterium]MBT4795456.1 protein BatD [Candidatus Neomarinimicrobiota bacterium]